MVGRNTIREGRSRRARQKSYKEYSDSGNDKDEKENKLAHDFKSSKGSDMNPLIKQSTASTLGKHINPTEEEDDNESNFDESSY